MTTDASHPVNQELWTFPHGMRLQTWLHEMTTFYSAPIQNQASKRWIKYFFLGTFRWTILITSTMTYGLYHWILAWDCKPDHTKWLCFTLFLSKIRQVKIKAIISFLANQMDDSHQFNQWKFHSAPVHNQVIRKRRRISSCYSSVCQFIDESHFVK